MYREQPKQAQVKIRDRIRELLKENQSYETAVNLVHLSCILSGVAMYEVLSSEGMDRETFIRTAEACLKPVADKKRKQMAAIAGLPGSYFILSRLAPSAMMLGNGCGWHTEKIKRTDKQFGFDTTRCIYHDLFGRYGIMELGPAFCRTDEVVYGSMPNIRFQRTGTLCGGSDQCDFRFHRK